MALVLVRKTYKDQAWFEVENFNGPKAIGRSDPKDHRSSTDEANMRRDENLSARRVGYQESASRRNHP